MKPTDIKQKSEADLKLMAAELRASMREMRFASSSNSLKEVRRIREARRMIARIETRLRTLK